MDTITHLQSAANILGLAVTDLTQQIAELKRTSLPNALRGWYLTREEYEALDKTRKKLNELLEGMSRNDIPDIMAEEGAKTLTLDDIGQRFTISQRVSCSMTDKNAGFRWLKEKGHDGIIQETVNAGTLSAFAKKEAEEGRDLPPEIFKISIMKYTSATKI